MSDTMRAAVYRGPGLIGVEDLPMPKPGEGEVRLQVGACGICGSDSHLLSQGWPFFPPGSVPGHEIAGTVEALGAGVTGLAEGDRVAVEPLHTCGSCKWCRAGRESICPECELYGVQRQGGFADFTVVPGRRLFAIPDDVEFPLAALAEPMAVSVHGLLRGGLVSGCRVMVLGAGTIGLLAVAAARALGAGEIVLSARHAHQAEMGRDLGATRVLEESQATPEALAELAPDVAPELVVETVGGTADTLLAAGAALAPGGTVSVLGLFTDTVTLDPMPLLFKEGTLAWSNCYARPRDSADFDVAIRIIDENREGLRKLLTHEMPLEEIAAAFELAGDKTRGSLKVSVVP